MRTDQAKSKFFSLLKLYVVGIVIVYPYQCLVEVWSKVDRALIKINDHLLCIKCSNASQLVKPELYRSWLILKRFEQTVLQVESYNMHVILQIFKRSISPSMPFFESLAKKLPTMMDDLFRWADKYSMLKSDVRTASQQVLVINHLAKNDKMGDSKPSNQLRQSNKRRDGRQQQ